MTSSPLRLALVLAGLCSFLNAEEASARQARGDTEATPMAWVTVLAGSLNIRQAASLSAPVVGAAARGDRLCVIGYEGDWARVVRRIGDRTPGTRSGFVSRGFVSETRGTREELAAIGC